VNKDVKQPISNISAFFSATTESPLSRPFYADRVPAGFPSPAESSEHNERLDLNEHLIRHPLATFFVRVAGDSMTGERIYDGDLLIVDRAADARHNHIVLAVVNGEFCVKRLQFERGRVTLCSANPAYPDIALDTEDQWEIWGRVIHSIHPH
jgi:DNA polymerase V